MRRRTALFLSMLGAVAVLALLRCQSPTEMVLEITTDVPCADFRGASVTVAGGPDVETSPPSATTSACAPDGTVGSIVLIPSGSKRDTVRIKIVGAEGRALESCASPPYAKGCIVARRRLSYIPHEPLHLRVALARACDDTPCDPDSTCVNGACRSAEVDPATCLGGGCGDPNGPSDAGAADAGDVVAPENECGDTRGLAQTPWPTAGRCPTRIGRSAFAGAQTSAVRWIFGGDNTPMNVAPVIGADGTIYVGNNSGKVYAVHPDGGLRWSAAVDGNVNGSAGAIAADGTLYIAAQNGGLYAIAPSGVPAIALPAPPSTVDYYRGAAAIAGDGTLFMGTSDGQLASLAPGGGGAQMLTVAVDAGKLESPTIGPDGTVYSVIGTSIVAFAGRPPKQLWSRDLFVSGPRQTPTDVMVGKDGFLYVGFGGALVSIDPAPGNVHERWRAPLPSIALAASPLAPAQGPDGAIFLQDATGAIVAVDPATGTPRVFVQLPSGSFGLGLTIDRDGAVYAMASDDTFRAFAKDGTPKWTVQLQEQAFTAAAIGADGTVYIAVGGSGLYAIGP